MEKRSSGKAVKKKKATRKATRKKKRALHPADVRQEVLEMVEDHAHAMTQAVIEQAEQGQLATVKYLFEVANILPSPKDGSETSKEEDSLAETLLDRLNIPKVPVGMDQEEGIAVSEEKAEVSGEQADHKDESSGGE